MQITPQVPGTAVPTPVAAVLTSDNNEAVGVDTNPLHTTPAAGDWGGIVFQDDSDHEAQGIFLNYVAHADISYGGGPVNVVGQQQVYDPIQMVSTRPTVIYNSIHDNSDAAMSANPDSFQFSLFNGNVPAAGVYTADYSRAGPLVHGNVLKNDSINGMFIRIRTEAGTPIDVLDVTARLTSTDIVYVLSENLEVQGQPGGAVLDSNGNIVQRVSAGGGVGGLIIDPGVIVKTVGARIEVGVGGQLIAEGTSAKPIIFTSLLDDSYGAGGVFDTTGDGAASAANPGDWSGFFFNPVSTGSFDHATITYAGGISSTEGSFNNFNAVEIYQATVRIADSILERNAGGADSTNRNGRGSNAAAAIYVIGAQPVIVNNIIRNNAGDAIDINANSLNAINVPDWGRQTGALGRFTQFDDNYGPLVRLNVLDSNGMNAMEVRGADPDHAIDLGRHRHRPCAAEQYRYPELRKRRRPRAEEQSHAKPGRQAGRCDGRFHRRRYAARYRRPHRRHVADPGHARPCGGAHVAGGQHGRRRRRPVRQPATDDGRQSAVDEYPVQFCLECPCGRGPRCCRPPRPGKPCCTRRSRSRSTSVSPISATAASLAKPCP